MSLDAVHQTGEPDTPIEVITALLGKALSASDADDRESLLKQAHEIAAGLDPYLDSISSPPDPIRQKLIARSMEHDWTAQYEQKKTIFHQKKECCAGSLEGTFLRALTRLTHAKNVLEVGMFTGTTTMAIADALPQDGKVYALEIEPYLEEFCRNDFKEAGVLNRVEVMVGSANESIDALAGRGQRFDIAFLDADKTGYLGYYKQLMDSQLIVPGGIIVVDNALMKGRTYAPGGVKDELADAIREFNQFVVKDDRVEVVAMPFRDGVSIIQRRPVKGSDADVVAQGVGNNLILQRFKLTNKVALITGAAQGIGRAYAHALGEAGAAVAVVDINQDKTEAAAQELRSKGIRSIAINADVTKAADCKRMVEETVQGLGGLHIAVNNAGINKNASGEDCPEDDWRATLEVNTTGVFLCCQAEARYMLEQGYGKIINAGSMAAVFVPHPQKQVAYNASKAAVIKITETLGTEWASRGINVNAISPGIVNTALIQESKELQPLVDTWLKQIPAGRLCDLGDLQAAIVFLASDASTYMVGHNLVLDGGHTLW